MPYAEVLERYTYEDYCLWEGDWEMIDGVPLAMAPAPMRRHQSLATEISFVLKEEFGECEECEVLAEFDYKVSDDTILRPDVVLSCHDDEERYLSIAPKIVVEVISKSTARRDEKYKFEIYQKEGVKYYILVYPDDLKAKVFKHDGKQYNKVGDFTKEVCKLDELECEGKIDFEKVFKRYRR